MATSSIQDSHSTLTDTFNANLTKSLKWRKQQLKQIWWMLEQNSDAFVNALHTDLHRHAFETVALEIKGTQADVIDNLKHIDEWAAGEKPDAGFLFGTLGKAHLRKEPLGLCLVIGAWNFPIATLVSPVVAAITAGNAVVMKPSELASATQDLLADLVPKYLDQSAIRVATGGPEETSKMLEFKWDHIFYTGGSKVGRIIATAGAKNLSRVILELGGQSPVIVCNSANVDLAAKRVAAAKITNLGQICLNANHVFADPAVHDELIQRLIHWNKEFAKDGGDEQFAHIINERHFDRISNLLKSSSGEVVYGGTTDRSTRWIQPTIVKDVMLDDSLLSEELFAPIAPVMVADVDRAIRMIKSRPHPLGMYIFSSDQAEINKILDSTSSGGVTINDIFLHAGVPGAPFGGVGESGYGSYHGKWGFDTFSHVRTVVGLPNWFDKLMGFKYPPFKVENAKMMEVKSNIVGRPNETMEEQTVGMPVSARSVIRKALMVAAVLAVMDSASGGKLLFVHTLRNVIDRFRRH